MTSDISQPAKTEFQSRIDALFGTYGLTLSVIFPPCAGERVNFHCAGIRVLEAKPIFNRKTGAVSTWHYLVLVAEMSIMDPFHCGHPLHTLACEEVNHKGSWIRMKDTRSKNVYFFQGNDPHSFDKHQAQLYKWWDGVVAEAGGETALAERLDQLADREYREVLQLRGPE